MTTTTLTPPKNLDLTVLHSPTEVRQWHAEWDAYREAIRAKEAADRLKNATTQAAENRVLTEAEYFAEAVKRHAAAQAKLAERQAAEKARQEADAAYLASSPETAEVLEHSEFLLLTKLSAWLSRGYRVTEDSIRFWLPGMYHVVVHKPLAATGGK